MANLSQTIQSDIRNLPRRFRGVIPKLIVLINGCCCFSMWLAVVQHDRIDAEYIFLLSGLSLPYVIVSYLLLSQRLKKTLTALCLINLCWITWVISVEFAETVQTFLLAIAWIPPLIINPIFLWRWKPGWRPQITEEADIQMYYEQAWTELNADNIQQGLWAQLYSGNKGDVEKTKAAYLKARVQQLRDAEDVEAEAEEEDAERDARKETVEELFKKGEDAFGGPTKRLDRKVKIAALVVSVCLFGYYLYYQSGDSPQILPMNWDKEQDKKGTTESTTQVSEGNPAALPHNGKEWSYTNAAKPATLKVNASGDANFFVKLAYPSSTSPVMTMFVRAGKTAQMNVPLGTYEFRYATGDVWYGEQRLFGQETIYNKADSLFEFEQTTTNTSTGQRIGTTGIEVTLYKVAGGNLRTRRIEKDQF
jgi:hypothetical protein